MEPLSCLVFIWVTQYQEQASVSPQSWASPAGGRAAALRRGRARNMGAQASQGLAGLVPVLRADSSEGNAHW